MTALEVDDNGWALGAVAPLDASDAWSVLSPAPESRVEAASWSHRAETFLGARVALVQPKTYPSHTLPLADAFDLDVARRAGEAPAARVRVVTVPIDRAPEVLTAAREAATRSGGGMDALVPRAKRLWQVAATAGPEPLVVAALLAMVWLGPVLPPDASALFGVKGAKERLATVGWRLP